MVWETLVLFLSAEFNFYVDPEAAKIVLTGINPDITPIYVLPWETVSQHLSSIVNSTMLTYYAVILFPL